MRPKNLTAYLSPRSRRVRSDPRPGLRELGGAERAVRVVARHRADQLAVRGADRDSQLHERLANAAPAHLPPVDFAGDRTGNPCQNVTA